MMFVAPRTVKLAARDAHHVADDQERERLRERFHEIDLAALTHLVDNSVQIVSTESSTPWSCLG